MRRLPNGSGSITKLSGNRSKPYLAREGKTGLQKCIGTFATKAEALKALSDFNTTPWNLEQKEKQSITMEALFEMYIEKRGERLGKSTLGLMHSSYKHCSPLHKRVYSSIKAFEMQDIIDDCPLSKSTKSSIKNLFVHLDKFAREMDISDKMYSDLVQVTGGTPRKQKVIFSDDEISSLWDGSDKAFYDSVLILLYTGFRISEMLELKVENINLEEKYMVGGKKTAAGINRTVPIHHRIYDMVAERCAASNKGYLIEYKGRPMNAHQYRSIHWERIMADIGASHTPHETRHTFRSRLDSAGAKRVCIDKIMGHSSGNVGEDIYTHKSLDELIETIEMLA